MASFPPSNKLKRGELRKYYLNEPIGSDSEDSDDEEDSVLKTFYNNYNKMKDYCEKLEDDDENVDLFYRDLESLNDAHDTYVSHTLETKLIIGLPWSKEQLDSEDGQMDGDMQMQYNIWKLSRKFCNYCAKFKLEKAKECHTKLLDLRREFLDFAENQDGLVRSTNVRSKEFNSDDGSKKIRMNECDVTLLPAGEVYRLVANSMKNHYDCEIEMYESSYDFRKQYSVYNSYMLNKHPSIFSATPAVSANVDDACTNNAVVNGRMQSENYFQAT